MRSATIKIFFDGGCRPNPGRMETAVVARGITYHRPDCGTGSNNDAEWLALIHAAEVALSIGTHDVLLLGDSALAVEQANGRAKCRSREFKAYLEKFQTLAREFDRIRIRKIPRTQNLAGIALTKSHQ
jgi:ribonuclease HI